MNVGGDAANVYTGRYSGAQIAINLPAAGIPNEHAVDDLLVIIDAIAYGAREKFESDGTVPRDAIDAFIEWLTRHMNSWLSGYVVALGRHGPDHSFTRRQFGLLMKRLTEFYVGFVDVSDVWLLGEIVDRRYGWIVDHRIDGSGPATETEAELRQWLQGEVEGLQQIVDDHIAASRPPAAAPAIPMPVIELPRQAPQTGGSD